MSSPRVVARTFVHATEDPKKVEGALLFATGLGREPEATSRLVRSRLKGHWGNPIEVLEVTLSRPRDVERFASGIRGTTLAKKLLAELEARLDEEGVLRFRLDKQEAVEGGNELERGGDAIQFELKFPRLPGRPVVDAVRAFFKPASNNV